MMLRKLLLCVWLCFPISVALAQEEFDFAKMPINPYLPTGHFCGANGDAIVKTAGAISYCEYLKADCRTFYVESARGVAPKDAKRIYIDGKMDLQCDLQRKKCPSADDCVRLGLSEKTKQAIRDLNTHSVEAKGKQVEP